MSHSVVLVVLEPTEPENIASRLRDALAPFDENREVPPYREYMTKDEASKAYERALKFYTDHPEHKPLGLDELNFTAVISAYQEEEVTEEPTEDGKSVRYYYMRTYNPNSRWDWYTVGGRWSDRFPIKEGMGDHPSLLRGERSWTNQNDPAQPGYADGGIKGALDFERLRRDAGTKAREQYARWCALASGFPVARGWTEIRKEHEARGRQVFGKDYDNHVRSVMDSAREEYNGQPLVAFINSDHTHEFNWWGRDPIEEFAPGEEAYVASAVADAVPGFALLTHTGQWIEPGQMGWFGVSSDDPESRAKYNVKANQYLDELPDDYLIISVDVHI